MIYTTTKEYFQQVLTFSIMFTFLSVLFIKIQEDTDYVFIIKCGSQGKEMYKT